jgi:hypothetical protein
MPIPGANEEMEVTSYKSYKVGNANVLVKAGCSLCNHVTFLTN